MLDIHNYISSGIIENYCLGLTSKQENEELERYCLEYPAIQTALEEHQLLFENYLEKYETAPPSRSRQRILDSLENEKIDKVSFDKKTKLIDMFVGISNSSSIAKWENLTSSITRPEQFNIYSHLLYRDSARLLAVTWIKELLPDEEHTNTIEKFLVLEGECTCTLGDKKIKMSRGSFLEIPLNVIHNIKVTSKEPLKIILSKQKVA